MKILLYSPAFSPHLGGIETVVEILAEELSRLGQEVTVVCRAPAAGPDSFPFRVVRRPTARHLLTLVRRCDVLFQANVSLRGLWPLLLLRRPWVVAHHSWYRRPSGRIGWQDLLKRALLRFAAASVSVSQAVAADLESRSEVIGNPFRDDLFRVLPDGSRHRDLVFLGRLVSDKGVNLLLEALEQLAARGVSPDLTVVGEGPETPRIEEQARQLGVAPRVTLAGSRSGEELVRILNEHRVLVVPSCRPEPFGVVALEGLACGCIVVVADTGGLKEAVGRCGRTFRAGDAADLARVLAEVLERPETALPSPEERREHLARHRRRRVAEAYLDVLTGAVSGRTGRAAPADRPREEAG